MRLLHAPKDGAAKPSLATSRGAAECDHDERRIPDIGAVA
jgi:hypothetical protein